MVSTNSESGPEQPQATAAAQHVTQAHSLLQRLQERLDRHPELEQAIEELEMALAKLTVKTGAML
jgi:hypothetical protein